MNKREIGTENERVAEKYLCALGMTLVERNFRTRHGEIDLIMKDRSALVFVEVKYRSGTGSGTALDAIDLRKRRQIVRISERFMMVHREYSRLQIRFDCIGINGDRISYIRNAFDARGNIL